MKLNLMATILIKVVCTAWASLMQESSFSDDRAGTGEAAVA